MKRKYHVFWSEPGDVLRSRENLSTLTSAHKIAQSKSRRFGRATVNAIDEGQYFHHVIELWAAGRRSHESISGQDARELTRRGNPFAGSLPVGKFVSVTVRAIRRKNGQVDIYR